MTKSVAVFWPFEMIDPVRGGKVRENKRRIANKREE